MFTLDVAIRLAPTDRLQSLDQISYITEKCVGLSNTAVTTFMKREILVNLLYIALDLMSLLAMQLLS